MTRIITPDDYQSQIDDLTRRLRALETAPSLQNSSIDGGALKVFDAAKRARVTLGLLPDNVNYGIEVDDAAGNKIMDSIGLAAVMSQPGVSAHPGGQNVTTVAPAYILLSSSAVTFTLARSATMLTMWDALASVSGTVAGVGTVALFIDGVRAGPEASLLKWGMINPGTSLPGFGIYPAVLAAGAHTLDLRGQVDNATLTLGVSYSDLWAFQLGG